MCDLPSAWRGRAGCDGQQCEPATRAGVTGSKTVLSVLSYRARTRVAGDGVGWNVTSVKPALVSHVV